jgi:competence protein ComEC
MPIRAIFFLLGDVVIQQLPQLPDERYLFIGLLVLSWGLWKRYWTLVALIFGMLWTTVWAMERLSDSLPVALESQDVQIEGYVLDLPKVEQRRVRFDFQISHANVKLPAKIRLNWYETAQNIKAGQQWRFSVKLKRPHGMLNAGGFDYETWLFSQGIGATGYIREHPAPQLLATSSIYNIKTWRQAIADKLSQLLPKNPQLGLIKALSIGDGNEITDAQWQVFRKTGTIHLIVISGSHISLVAGFVFFLTRALWIKSGCLRIAPQTFAAAVAMVAAILYAGLAGFSLPTQRAMMMVAVIMLTLIFQRHVTFTATISRVLWLILLFDPFAVLSIGFWLSFTSVVMIVYCTAARLGRLRYFFPLLGIHGMMAIALAPILLFSFQQISLISPIANCIAVPVVEFLAVPLLLLALPLLFLQPWLASKILGLIAQLLQGLYWLLEKLALLPFAVFTHPQPPYWAMLLAMVGVFLLFAPKGIPARWLSLAFCLPLFFNNLDKPKAGEFTLTLLDVGQGLATVVQTQQHLLVFDTGAKLSSDFDMGNVVVLPFLYSAGATKLDRVIISHGDNDHLGGLQSLLAAMPIDSIYSSVPKKIAHFPASPCLSGQQWDWDNVNFKIVSPAKNQFNAENDNSCVLKIDSIHGSVLLTGDIESTAENWLVKQAGKELSSHILIAPHHGSKTSSTLPFLQQINPQWILIPAAYKNRYHFPHSDVIQRYQQQSIPWLMTGTAGAITVYFAAGNRTIRAYRNENARYWYSQ